MSNRVVCGRLLGPRSTSWSTSPCPFRENSRPTGPWFPYSGPDHVSPTQRRLLGQGLDVVSHLHHPSTVDPYGGKGDTVVRTVGGVDPTGRVRQVRSGTVSSSAINVCTGRFGFEEVSEDPERVGDHKEGVVPRRGKRSLSRPSIEFSRERTGPWNDTRLTRVDRLS